MKERKKEGRGRMEEKCLVLVKQMFVLELLDFVARSSLACHRRRTGKE